MFLTIALAIVASAGTAATAAAQVVETPATDWLVYQRLDAQTSRGIIGRFEVDAEGFKYQSLNLLDSWVIDLASVESITIEDLAGQGLLSSTIVLAGVQGGKHVRRLIAPIDPSFRPPPISVLAGLMHYKLQQFKEAKTAAAARPLQNAPQ